MIIDQYGMIQSGGDGGDSCQRMYTSYLRISLQFYLGLMKDIPEPFTKTALPLKTDKLLEVDPGIYIRNPDPTKWYSDPRNFSRDQMTPVICYNTLATEIHPIDENYARAAQLRLLKACLKRYMFAQNIYPNWVDPRTEAVTAKTPDFIDPGLWGIFARSWINTKYMPIAFLFVILGDIFLLFSALFKVFAPITKDSNGGIPQFRMPGPDDVDDDNMNNVLMVTQYVFPTIFSTLARKIYKFFRRKNLGNTQLNEKSAIMGAIAWYNHTDNPEMTELARPLVERY